MLRKLRNKRAASLLENVSFLGAIAAAAFIASQIIGKKYGEIHQYYGDALVKAAAPDADGTLAAYVPDTESSGESSNTISMDDMFKGTIDSESQSTQTTTN